MESANSYFDALKVLLNQNNFSYFIQNITPKKKTNRHFVPLGTKYL